MASVLQQEWKIFNQKGELMQIVLAPAAETQAQVVYRAGVPEEYIDLVKNASHQPTHIDKK